ncbi:MAG: hypothetical protein ACLQVD_09665 [Capsulimonadaceae bacterium]
MSLRYLFDETIPRVIAYEVRRHRPQITVESVHSWHGGAYLGSPSAELLKAAAIDGLTLVTYDRYATPACLAAMLEEGTGHAGVILVDRATIPNSAFGPLTRLFIHLYETEGSRDWSGRVVFLTKPARK